MEIYPAAAEDEGRALRDASRSRPQHAAQQTPRAEAPAEVKKISQPLVD
jgi:hypothetical protein